MKLKRKDLIEELKKLSLPQFEERLKEVEKKLFNLVFDKNLRKIKDTSSFKNLRRERARLKTFIRQKELDKVKENDKS